MSQAVPLDLIANEAITNAIKYAFGDSGKDITISLTQINDLSEQIRLTIGDNGQGIPAHFDHKSSKSLGMTLMTGLCRQLRGEIRFFNCGGLPVELILPKVKLIS